MVYNSLQFLCCEAAVCGCSSTANSSKMVMKFGICWSFISLCSLCILCVAYYPDISLSLYLYPPRTLFILKYYKFSSFQATFNNCNYQRRATAHYLPGHPLLNKWAYWLWQSDKLSRVTYIKKYKHFSRKPTFTWCYQTIKLLVT